MLFHHVLFSRPLPSFHVSVTSRRRAPVFCQVPVSHSCTWGGSPSREGSVSGANWIHPLARSATHTLMFSLAPRFSHPVDCACTPVCVYTLSWGGGRGLLPHTRAWGQGSPDRMRRELGWACESMTFLNTCVFKSWNYLHRKANLRLICRALWEWTLIGHSFQNNKESQEIAPCIPPFLIMLKFFNVFHRGYKVLFP